MYKTEFFLITAKPSKLISIWLSSTIKVWHSNLLLIRVWIFYLLIAVSCLNVAQQCLWCISWNMWVFGIGIFMECLRKKDTTLVLFCAEALFHVNGYVNSHNKSYPPAENHMSTLRVSSRQIKSSECYAVSTHRITGPIFFSETINWRW